MVGDGWSMGEHLLYYVFIKYALEYILKIKDV